MVKLPKGDWGHQVYEFANLYIDTLKEKRNIYPEIEPWELESYPEKVDDEDDFFNYCKDIRDEIDELIAE
ncbi:MAG: hypothetical protein H8Z69_00445 [Nanohaloarchaea archaeon]|nr:hypothetical protein [Candidatus Nanohaloarchaea archaeon]